MTDCTREERDNLEGLGVFRLLLPEAEKVSLEHFAAAASGLADEARQLEEFTLSGITGVLRTLAVSILFLFTERIGEFTFSEMIWDFVSVRWMGAAILRFPFVGLPFGGLDDLLWACLVSSMKLLWLSDVLSLQGLSDKLRDLCVCFPAWFSFGVFAVSILSSSLSGE